MADAPENGINAAAADDYDDVEGDVDDHEVGRSALTSFPPSPRSPQATKC